MAGEAPRPTLWQRFLCWRRYHTWHCKRCIVCGIGVFGDGG